MKKSEEGWILTGLHHLGNKQIWLDLLLHYKEKDTGYNSNATGGNQDEPNRLKLGTAAIEKVYVLPLNQMTVR